MCSVESFVRFRFVFFIFFYFLRFVLPESLKNIVMEVWSTPDKREFIKSTWCNANNYHFVLGSSVRFVRLRALFSVLPFFPFACIYEKENWIIIIPFLNKFFFFFSLWLALFQMQLEAFAFQPKNFVCLLYNERTVCSALAWTVDKSNETKGMKRSNDSSLLVRNKREITRGGRRQRQRSNLY